METKIGKIGFILGKFYPLHKGHIHLIEYAAKNVERLIVIIGSLKSETIAGEIRFGWLKQTFPNLEIHHLTDENPQYPEEHPDFWNIWKTSIRKCTPEKIDFVFSSEIYGDTLAKCLDAKHICVDLDRKTFPVSGTKIRKNPMKYWNYLSDAAKPYFVRKVVLYGPESTGKTTLSQKLANHFDTVWIPEFAREYLEVKANPMELEMSDFLNIAQGQIKLEEKAIHKANRILICDTDLLVTKVLSDHYMNSCLEFISIEAYSREYALHLLTYTDIPWVADVLRDRPNQRAEMFQLFKIELEKANRPYKLISGNFEERFQKAVEIIKREILMEDNEREN
ncbi:MAG: AAA family ATPase [Leptospiraceae bacterium]|nr:AAA family ATPase [Leptospiraceae bacterium]